MDKVGEVATAPVSETTGFLKYVFAFDDEVKCQVGNMLQYASMALLPVLGILKAVQHIVPEEDYSKGSVTLALESFGQIALILVLTWLADRAIRYVPTMSGCAYGEFQPIAFTIPFLIIMATMQTKLGAKLGTIMDRVIGDDDEPAHHKAAAAHKKHATGHQGHGAGHQGAGHHGHGGGVRVTQPLSGGTAPPQHHPSQADSLGNARLVPDDRELTAMPATAVPQHVQPQQSPDFNKMYQGPDTPLQNAATPGGGQQPGSIVEPMAANEVLGGGMGSAW